MHGSLTEHGGLGSQEWFGLTRACSLEGCMEGDEAERWGVRSPGDGALDLHTRECGSSPVVVCGKPRKGLRQGHCEPVALRRVKQERKERLG